MVAVSTPAIEDHHTGVEVSDLRVQLVGRCFPLAWWCYGRDFPVHSQLPTNGMAVYCACLMMADEDTFEAVKKRIEDRQAGLQRKREERLQMGDNHETMRFFHENFTKVKGGMSCNEFLCKVLVGSARLSPPPSRR